MTEQLVDPDLQEFLDSNPEILHPDVPEWWDNAVVELAGAILATRGLAAMRMRALPPPAIDQVQAVAGQAWRHYAPTWLRFSVPAVQQVYTAGRVTGLTSGELEAMATAHAETLGDYLESTSAEALMDGYITQLNQKWDSTLAWHRASEAYGLDRPDMRTYVRAVMAQPPASRDPIGTGARMLMDRLMIARADNVAKNETWTAGQTGLALSWRIRAGRGDLDPDTRRVWMTRKRETACEICGPMDGQSVALDEDYTLPDGSKIMAPAVHPGCQCSQRLAEPISKAGKSKAAGIVLVAADTGRVLMLQRARGDRSGGMWEFPGGKIDAGETPIAAARREYREEVRSALPSDARLISDWKWGVYEGFVHMTPREADVEPHRRGRAFNPDDPNRKQIEAIAWWDPEHVARNPAVRPEVRRSWSMVRDAIRDSRIAKAKRLDDGRLDDYDRTTKGQFAAREYRTRDVTRLADPVALPAEVQQILDDVERQVTNPFAIQRAEVAAPTRNPFGATSAFIAGANPFAAKANPFAAAATGANPFKGKTGGPNPFDRTTRAKVEVPERLKRKRVVHHIFMPKKRFEDAAEYSSSAGHYIPFDEWQGTFEWDGNPLIQPGERFDFNEPAATNADAAAAGSGLNDEAQDVYDKYSDDSMGVQRLDPDLAPRELLQMFSLVGVQTSDPWHDMIPHASDRFEDVGEGADGEQDWHEILRVAHPLWDEILDRPQKAVQALSRQELDHIYDMAGYERNEDDASARDRIVDACQAHGIGDDSLAEAFADHVIWTKSDQLGEEGRLLTHLLEQAREIGLPDLTSEYGDDPVYQFFTFDRGFHPDTLMRAGGELADIDGDYTVHHVIYRSNLGETGGEIPFVTGIREAAMWPADKGGHFLHGGPYRDHP